ncbi:ketoacyl-ACP synthase III [Patulibacter sp. SYSU D01012]|uniref:3-oxoacyl-ACP synthase III family protein n=1 Tax=Patulibacter sp. SYSU D01012 TaxID=2817381 RepID=UPI001B30325D|nr:ketoacyl-ACP synthase III [Patulibacter sp. SYSU D01012]
MPTSPAPGAVRVAPLGVGAALPDTVVTSAEIEERLGLDPGWLQKRTHIAERRILGPGERITDFGLLASQRALADAGVDASEVDLVIAACLQSDDIAPSMSAVVSAGLGTRHAGGFDISSGCSGFVASVATAAGLIEAGRARTVVVVAAEAMSRLTDKSDRATAGLLGDGAGAIVLRGETTPATAEHPGRTGRSVFGSDGENGGTVRVATDHPSIYDDGEFGPGKAGQVQMNGFDTYKTAVERFESTVRETAAVNGVTLDDVDLVVLHQANGRILEAVRKRLELPEERLASSVQSHGNTSAASVALALADARAQGRVEPGTRLLLAGFGSGLAWAGITMTWEGSAA